MESIQRFADALLSSSSSASSGASGGETEAAAVTNTFLRFRMAVQLLNAEAVVQYDRLKNRVQFCVALGRLLPVFKWEEERHTRLKRDWSRLMFEGQCEPQPVLQGFLKDMVVQDVNEGHRRWKDEIPHHLQEEACPVDLVETGKDLMKQLMDKAEESEYGYEEELLLAAGRIRLQQALDWVPFNVKAMRKAASFFTEAVAEARIKQKSLDKSGGGKAAAAASASASSSSIEKQLGEAAQASGLLDLKTRLGEALKELNWTDRLLQKANISFSCARCERFEAVGEKFQICRKCKRVRYCSKDCQLTAWKDGHKQQCRRFVAEGASEPSQADLPFPDTAADSPKVSEGISARAEDTEAHVTGLMNCLDRPFEQCRFGAGIVAEHEKKAEELRKKGKMPPWADVHQWETSAWSFVDPGTAKSLHLLADHDANNVTTKLCEPVEVFGFKTQLLPPFDAVSKWLSPDERDRWHRLRSRLEAQLALPASVWTEKGGEMPSKGDEGVKKWDEREAETAKSAAKATADKQTEKEGGGGNATETEEKEGLSDMDTHIPAVLQPVRMTVVEGWRRAMRQLLGVGAFQAMWQAGEDFLLEQIPTNFWEPHPSGSLQLF
uniref:phytol kinase n=1 Tax=Chromera velia CCMP2878 TaxID=1169474 RepID=A0A0G4ICX8_9ALVE|eukprot:Cvel_2279.t1-p1 / transcript=Cvel_2279.t1 / gene=Cvel_2279 / organism=Chromera_velia_CCMP2878 / gene_product=hypothetical protein / transcript_product=hypothetical protein / location=Cvel_scaffold88:66708-70350(-) / protein_length=607 / sequence_SO=supercontig / SO=protein_coding / is_pseudo=false